MDASPLCECGCGEPAPIIRANNTARGYVAGQYHRFIPGHQNRGRVQTAESRAARSRGLIGHPVSEETRQKISANHRAKGIRPPTTGIANLKGGLREANGAWKGGVSETNGYRCIYQPDHSRAMPNGYVYEHILIAESKLGRPLRPGEVVHHDDENKANNAPDNLIVLSSHSEHAALHGSRRRTTRR